MPAPRQGSADAAPRAQAAAQHGVAYAQANARTVCQESRLKPYVYKDFGSLVSLGEYSTVGNLMGFVVGKSMFVEGYFARLMYRSLHKMHEMALHGRARSQCRR